MITLTLLHPSKNVPLQNWTFETESAIRIGRSTNNEVVLYSAVVSRHHVEIKRNGLAWELVNLGANGTYIDGQPVKHAQITDGTIIHLANSGPKIQIRFQAQEPETQPSLDRPQTAPAEEKRNHPVNTDIPSLPQNSIDLAKGTMVSSFEPDEPKS